MNEFDDLADLDEVFGPLRSPARAAELSRESATVDLMVKSHRTSEGKHMFTSRRARIATLVAAGVLGFGGMAAASTPNLFEEKTAETGEAVVEQPVVEEPVVEEPVVEEPVVEEPVVEEPVVEEPVVEEPVVEESVVEEPVGDEDAPPFEDDPDTDFNEEYCEEGNHGKTVSAVARGTFDFSTYEAENPDATLTVKTAAQSSCGKMGEVADSDEIEDESEDESEEVSEIESEKSEAEVERPRKSDKGDKGAEKSANGKSNGNGNGKSNGKGG